MMATQYVFLVHGTWAYPPEAREPEEKALEEKKPEKEWYATDSTFAERLLKELTKDSRESIGWRLQGFTWEECGNIHADRVKASKALVKRIEELRDSDPNATIHFVAHSHGGNVVIEALSRWFDKLYWSRHVVFDSAVKEIVDERHKTQKEAFVLKSPPTQEEMRAALERALERSSSPLKNLPPHMMNKLCSVPQEPAPEPRFFSTLDITNFGSVASNVNRRMAWSRKAAAIWIAHPAAHGIGRLVFLGTPFLMKKWRSNRGRWPQIVEKTRQVTRAAFGLLLTMLIVGALVMVFIDPSKLWNPLEWSLWAVGIVLFIALVTLPSLGHAIRESERHDTNIYFDRGMGILRLLGEAMRDSQLIPCRVVSARLMDEALIALSTRPVLHAAFKPELRRWLGLPPVEAKSTSKSSDKDTSKEESSSSRGRSIYLERGVDWDVWQRSLTPGEALMTPAEKILSMVLLPVTFAWRHLWQRALGPIIERRTVRTVQKVIEMTASGLPADELRRADVEVSEHIGVPEVFDEKFLDVTEAAVGTAPSRAGARVPKRYGFLLPGGNLPGKIDPKHHLYGSLKGQGVDDLDLLKTALVIDERVRELVGAIDLVHSTYYGNENVICDAAHFLRTGTVAVRGTERPHLTTDARTP